MNFPWFQSGQKKNEAMNKKTDQFRDSFSLPQSIDVIAIYGEKFILHQIINYDDKLIVSIIAQ